MKADIKIEYVKKVLVIFKDSSRSIDEFEFGDFIMQIATGMINLEDIEYITQEGSVAVRYIQNHGGVFKRA